MGLLGLLIASTFVLYREANALSNMLEFPIALVTGLLVRDLLVARIGRGRSVWVLAPTWAVRVIREAALGGDPLFEIGMCILLGGVYLVLAWHFLARARGRARAKATLSLA